MPYPSPSHEQWRFTNLRALAALPTTPSDVNLRTIASCIPAVTGPHSTLVNGVWRADMTLLNHLSPHIQLEADAPLPKVKVMDELDELTSSACYRIICNKGDNNILYLNHIITGTGAPVANAVRVVVAPGATLTLVEFLVGTDGTQRWTNPRTFIDVHAGATLNHVIVQTLPHECILTRRDRLHVADNATYNRFTLQTGGQTGRIEAHVTSHTCGHIALNGLHLTRANQTHDATVQVAHTDIATRTHVLQRNIVAGDESGSGHAVFQGKFYVHEKAQKTDAYMLCQSLLLHETARASFKPELEIYADDVKCSHGASTGSLQPDQLFYLRARGLPETDAKRLLVSAFADSMLDHVPSHIREVVENPLRRWFNNMPTPINHAYTDAEWVE